MVKRKLVRTKKARRKNKLVIKELFFAVAVVSLILVGLILYSFGVFDRSEPQKFEVKDECGQVLGNLIHQIRDAGECRLKCVNECDVRGMEFVRFEFEGKITDCNSCDCWCE